MTINIQNQLTDTEINNLIASDLTYGALKRSTKKLN